MRLLVTAITFAVTMGGLFLFENYQTTPQELNYAKLISELQQTNTPSTSPQPTKTPTKTTQTNKQAPASKLAPSPASTGSLQAAVSGSPQPLPSAANHIYHTSSASQAKYYYCDTDSDWKNLSKANLKQFSSSDELLVSYPSRTLHEPCR